MQFYVISPIVLIPIALGEIYSREVASLKSKLVAWILRLSGVGLSILLVIIQMVIVALLLNANPGSELNTSLLGE